MFGSQTLDVAIGVVFVFLLVSVLCTVVREGIEGWLKTRAAYLEYGIRQLLHDKGTDGLAAKLYEHPLIYSLFSGTYDAAAPSKKPGLFAQGGDLPSYIPAKSFAMALLDMAARGPNPNAAASAAGSSVVSLDAVRSNIANLKNPQVQRVLLTAIDSAQGDLDRAIKNIEDWYDSGMDRVSGWYKRASQWVIFWIALFLAVSLNINIVAIGDFLYRNDTARALVVAEAEKAAKTEGTKTKSYQEVNASLASLRLPIHWVPEAGTPKEGATAGEWVGFVLYSIPGWLITALAAMLGAPFWFDVLNKFMVIRSTVKPHEKSPEEGSEDRQASSGRSVANGDGARASAGTAGAVAAGAVAAGAVAANMQIGSLQNAPDPPDRDSGVDACDVDFQVAGQTADHELPQATGGVA